MKTTSVHQPMYHVAATTGPEDLAFQALCREDWRSYFDVLELEAEQLALLDSIGLWDDIGRRCSALIDIHEEARIEAKDLGLLLECIAHAQGTLTPPDEEAQPLLERLRSLTEGARSRNVSVWFLF